MTDSVIVINPKQNETYYIDVNREDIPLIEYYDLGKTYIFKNVNVDTLEVIKNESGVKVSWKENKKYHSVVFQNIKVVRVHHDLINELYVSIPHKQL